MRYTLAIVAIVVFGGCLASEMEPQCFAQGLTQQVYCDRLDGTQEWFPTCDTVSPACVRSDGMVVANPARDPRSSVVCVNEFGAIAPDARPRCAHPDYADVTPRCVQAPPCD